MSIEQLIEQLESEKQSYVREIDQRIASLKSFQAQPPAAIEDEIEAPPIRPGSRFRPIPNTGMPASEMILRDRG